MQGKDGAIGLEVLEERVMDDLKAIEYPNAAWVPERRAPSGAPLLDVLIVGGGQGGLAIAHALKRVRVDRVRVLDRAREGLEGPWMTYARMPTLRSPKEVNGPDLDIPALAFRSWFVAQHGRSAWTGLNKISKQDWAAYLLWLRRVLGIEIENGVDVEYIAPSACGTYMTARARCLETGRLETVEARQIVVATGIESPGRWWTPPAIEALDKRYWAHTNEEIDFAALKGKRIAILGAAASAFDNAATALEAGAGSVVLCSRRPDLQRVQPFKWLSFPGFLGHFSDLDDAWRWRIMNHLLSVREAFPAETWTRASRHSNFTLMTGAPWTSCSERDGSVRIETPAGPLTADFVIAGTGFQMDLTAQPELAAIAEVAALWRDRYTPPEGEENPRLGTYPYLDSKYAFTEREPGAAPWLRHVRLFTYGSALSFGPSGSSINAMKFAVPKLVAGILSDLFTEDIETHWASLRAYDLPEFLLPGEEGEVAPVKAVIERTA